MSLGEAYLDPAVLDDRLLDLLHPNILLAVESQSPHVDGDLTMPWFLVLLFLVVVVLLLLLFGLLFRVRQCPQLISWEGVAVIWAEDPDKLP